MLSLLRKFNGQNFTEWDATVHHVVNTMGCQMALGIKPSPVITNNVETEESYRARENWDNQNSQAYGNLMLCISPNVRNLTVKARMDTMKNLLDWLKIQYKTTSISAAYTDIVIVDKLQVLGDCDPMPTIDKLLALFT